MLFRSRSFLSTITRAGVIAGKSGCAIAPEKRASSASTARMSSCRVTSQARLPFHNVTGQTAPEARTAAYCGGGSNGQVRWNGKDGARAMLRSASLTLSPASAALLELRALLGPEHVRLVRGS